MSEWNGPASLTVLTDRTELTEVVFRLARAMDTRDWPLLSTCYTPESIGLFATGEVAGLEMIKRQYEAFLIPLDVTQHMVSNIECSIVGEKATVRSYFQAQHVRAGAEGGAHFMIGGRYDDQMVRTPDGWRIAVRQVSGLWSQGNPRVLGGTLNPPRGA